MKLELLEVVDFLGIKRVELTFGPITFVAGDNWSGKSSLQQALRLVLTGEVERVSKIADYWMLVRDGAKAGQITLVDGENAIRSALVSAKKSNPRENNMIPVCNDRTLFPLLNQRTFSSREHKLRREMIFAVGHISTDENEIAKRLIDAGADPVKVDEIKPLLKAGFDGATDTIKQALTNLRQQWQYQTGEIYGDKKGADWKFDTITAALAPVKELADSLAKRKQSLTLAINAEAEQENVVNNLIGALQKPAERCEQCNKLVILIEDEEEQEEAEQQLARQREGLAMLKRATQSRARDVSEAEEAVTKLVNIEAQAAERTAKAADAHKRIQEWKKLLELLSWDGLPTQMMSNALMAINNRLTKTAALTRWPVVQVRDDMEITVGNRVYGLCSESEQWIADAALTEAMSFVSGHNLLVLDRMDVLHPLRRGDLVDWLFELRNDSVQSIVFATLKSAPKFDGARSYWLDNGEIGKPT